MSATYDNGTVPTYIAQCPECDSLIACHVADVSRPQLMSEASKDALRWTRDGYKVSTVTVHDVRTWPSGKTFKHGDGCSRDKRRKPKTERRSSGGLF